MRLLRLLADYTLYDHKRNKNIRMELNMNIAFISDIKDYRNKWYKHILWVSKNTYLREHIPLETSWEKKILWNKLKLSRPRGLIPYS